MATRGLYVFKHDSELGNAPAHALFERLQVNPSNPGVAARSFAEYQVTFDGQTVSVSQQGLSAANGVQLMRLA